MTGSPGFRGFIAAVSAVCGILAGVLGGWLTGHWQWGAASAFVIMVVIAAGSLGFRDLRGFIAAVSAVCGILAGVLGGWLTGHWQWGVASAFMIMIIIVATTEFLKIVWGHGQAPRDPDYSGRAASSGVRVGAVMLTVLASLGSAGGTLYYIKHVASAHPSASHRPPATTSPEPAAALAAAGGHGSPAAAVSGFLGNSLLGAYSAMCGYYLPSQQPWCRQHAPHGRAESGRAAIGEVDVHGPRAVVAVVGRICVLNAATQSGGPCLSSSSPSIGLGPGTSFSEAFNQAAAGSYRGLMWSCEQVHGAWYVTFTKLQLSEWDKNPGDPRADPAGLSDATFAALAAPF